MAQLWTRENGFPWMNSSPTLPAIGVILVTIVVFTLARYALASTRPKNYPPGPPTVPFLGNLHLLPSTKSFKQFHEWSRDYGPILGLKFGPTNVVVLNNYRDVQELMEKRSGIYASRPPNYIATELINPNGTHILFSPYGPGWKSIRKAAQALFTPRELHQMLPIQNAEATQMVYDMIHDPNNHYRHIQRYTTAVILASVFGQRGVFESHKVRALYDTQHRFSAILEPGATPPVDAFKILQYVPEYFASYKRKAKELRKEQRALYIQLLDETKERMWEGNGTGCYMEKLLENKEKSGLSEEHIAYVGGTFMEAGSDTTACTLSSFMLGILSNPEALKKAQKDVDRRCGADRSPGIDDIDSMPYIEACVREVLRWRPAVAGGIPHMLTQTDQYKGYVFPAGTVFFANSWGIHHDENEYEDPEIFNPDRWLNNRYGTRYPIDDQVKANRNVTYAFGCGRRVCVGQKLAENSLRIVIAKLVWGFDISKVEGKEVDTSIETAYDGGLLAVPKEFPAVVRPRSRRHVEVAEAEFAELKPFYEKFAEMD
ncbi:hypothetical protein FQN54_006578 [Arachnomyces sp. PD_36]|nr:hypothetical protein FQN54_006578 [Arachnomyces sp. PD_36]